MKKKNLIVLMVVATVSACSLQSDVDNPSAMAVTTASIDNGVLNVKGTGFANLTSLSVSQDSGGTSSLALSNVSTTKFTASLPSALTFPASLLMDTAHAETVQPLSSLTALSVMGKLGVGTPDPVGTLVVSNGDNEGLEITPGTNNIIVGGYNRASNVYVPLSIYAGNFRFFPSGGNTNNFMIDSTGNVGIGTTAPAAKLHVSLALLGSTPTYRGNAIIETADVDAGVNGLEFMSSTSGAGFGHRLASVVSSGGTNVDFRIQSRQNSATWSNPFVIQGATGNVGIGTVSPNYQLELSTDSAGKPGTSTWTVASDERLKDIRAPFTRGLDAIRGLNAIYFNYKKDNPLNLPSQKEYVGVRAQDVEKVIPEAVSVDKLGYLHVTNDAIIWTAINAIQELEKENSDLKQRLERQQQDLDAIKSKLGL